MTIRDALPGLEEATIRMVERQSGRKIPHHYRDFLKLHNGGKPTPSNFTFRGAKKRIEKGSVKSFLGIGTGVVTLDLLYVLQTFGSRMPSRMYPIARDPGGNLIVVSDAGEDEGQVFLWDHEREADDGPPHEDNLFNLADSLQQFIDRLE